VDLFPEFCGLAFEHVYGVVQEGCLCQEVGFFPHGSHLVSVDGTSPLVYVVLKVKRNGCVVLVCFQFSDFGGSGSKLFGEFDVVCECCLVLFGCCLPE